MKNFLYIVAALAGAGLIIYGAFFYTKPNASSQQASIIPQIINQQTENNTNDGFKDPVLGEENAPVTIIEYGSYLCGHCITFSRETFPEINKNYIETGKVKFIYRSYPPYELGMALMCANEQNKFWEYHEYAVQNDISKIEDLKFFAINAGLMGSAFDQCFDSGKYQSSAEKVITDGQNAGVAGTPTFFINNQKIVGALPYEDFAKAIDTELEK